MTDFQTFHTIITDFESAYQKLIAIAEAYPERLQTQSGACGAWSAREVIAHLSGWMVEAMRRFPRFAIGTGDITYNKDTFNSVSVRLRRGRDYESIVAELRDVSAKLAQFSRTLPDHEIQHNGHRYAEWLTNLTREAYEHSIQLQEFAR